MVTKTSEQGVTNTNVVVGMMFIILLILIGIVFIILSDRLNGNDAYRVRELREQRDGLKKDCEDNFRIVGEWLRQQKVQPFNLIPCRPIQPIEKPEESK